MTSRIDLLERGYFPHEIVPAFQTFDLARLHDREPNLLPDALSITQPVVHSMPRVGGTRRIFRLPNPKSYFFTSGIIETCWPFLESHFRQSRLSISRPVSTPDGKRAVGHSVDLSESPAIQARNWASGRYLLRADVTQCYASLYTHAIPWALHTKAAAKKKRKGTEGANIDEAFRAMMWGQTSGVPIGPDASLIAAEIVLTAVDADIQDRVSSLQGFRNIDDFELVFPTRLRAEEARSHLEHSLNFYELTLNSSKTRILELPQPLEPQWKHELTKMVVRLDNSAATKRDLIDYFSLAFDLSRGNPQDAVVKFALQRARAFSISDDVWPLFEGLVLTSATTDSSTLSIAIDLLRFHSDHIEVEIDKELAAKVIEAQILNHSTIHHGGEVSSAIWSALLLGIPLSKAAATKVSQMHDDLVALLALEANEVGLFKRGGLATDMWKKMFAGEQQPLDGPHWLLAYEGIRHGWLQPKRDFIAEDPFFTTLADKDVHFYFRNHKPDPFTGPTAARHPVGSIFGYFD